LKNLIGSAFAALRAIMSFQDRLFVARLCNCQRNQNGLGGSASNYITKLPKAEHTAAEWQ
jgi:hypothetical protein